ncbi:MAG TPA: hypothetical protein VM844_00025, partial [Miltoncostaeaceae bacterium]|nr:hypothetical protein [Miltoncostaeaceae bacterium]
MRAALRLLVVTLIAGLVVGVGSAGAAIQDMPEFSFSPHTKAAGTGGNAKALTLTWLPPIFNPPSGPPGPADHQDVIVTEVGGGTQTYSAGPTQGSLQNIFVTDGRQYTITVAACQTAGTCPLGVSGTAQTSGTTIIDATPPSGTVQVNGGAAFTNNRTVTLSVAASDPLIDNLPNTSSGVTQAAVDVDGNGTIPCDIIFGQNPDISGCAQNFAPTLTAALPAGDGPKTVGVYFGDGARENSRPCRLPIVCGFLFGSPILGNASAEALDAIGLDTAKPIALATQDRFTVNRGETAAHVLRPHAEPVEAERGGAGDALEGARARARG